MTPDLIQTQFLKRYITMTPKPIPVCGPFMNVSVSSAWFASDDNDDLTITRAGIMAFWRGVRKHGHKAIMQHPLPPRGPNNTPTGGTPVAVAA